MLNVYRLREFGKYTYPSFSLYLSQGQVYCDQGTCSTYPSTAVNQNGPCGMVGMDQL